MDMIPTMQFRWMQMRGSEIEEYEGPISCHIPLPLCSEKKYTLQQKWIASEAACPMVEWRDIPYQDL